jgi:hypothetical protein
MAYLRDVEEPEPVPNFDELEQAWKRHFKSSLEQKRKCPIAFADFRAVTQIATVEDIKPHVVVAYRDAVYARNLTGKSQSNLFTRIRRYLSFFRDRAIAIDTINRALGYLALLSGKCFGYGSRIPMGAEDREGHRSCSAGSRPTNTPAKTVTSASLIRTWSPSQPFTTRMPCRWSPTSASSR